MLAHRRKGVKLDSNGVNPPCGQSNAVVLVSKGLDMRGWFLLSPTEKAEAWLGDACVGSCPSKIASPLGCFAVAKERLV